MTGSLRNSRDAAGGMLLIHGAWQGSWAWDAWLPELTARGWDAHAVDLPGNGVPGSPIAHAHASLESYVDALADAASRMRGPLVVVGHSGGGLAASQLAERMPERVTCLVYIAGMMLPSGLAFADLVGGLALEVPGVAGIGPYLEWSDDLAQSRVPPAAALDIFLHDCAPHLARDAAAQLRPQQESGRAIVTSLTPDRYGRVPRVYIEALRDRSLLLPVQRRMQTLSPGALVKSIDTGHVPQLARPAELADIVCSALAELGIEAPHAASLTTPTPSIAGTAACTPVDASDDAA
jgi:pimeloyl-ACP methyl ester carboxylesterase